MSYRVLHSIAGGPSDNTTRYVPLNTSNQTTISAVEANSQTKMYDSGVFLNFGCRVNANSAGSSTTVTIRKNGANGNQSVTIGAGITGRFEDSTNTDSFSNGDLMGAIITAGGTLTVTRVFADRRMVNCINRVSSWGVVSFATASATRYIPMVGDMAITTTEPAQISPRTSEVFTIRNFNVYVSANGRSTTTTFRVRKNNANGNGVISVGAGLTGLFEDTSNTDTTADNDVFNYSMVTGTGTGTITIRDIGVGIHNDKNIYQAFAALSTGSSIISGVTRWVPLWGHPSVFGGVAAAENVLYGNGVISKLRCYILTNGTSSSSTIVIQKNGADTGVTISVGSGVTGWVTDNTNKDYFVNGDAISLKIVNGGGGSLILAIASAQIDINTEEYQHPMNYYQ